ncbi:MAG: hypothetical protein A07HB70_01661 [uncultured archaeon A07HB70]|nr:MAG: hypothetical protein A07HB70_01661 [uncultured archaeon A07HB70]
MPYRTEWAPVELLPIPPPTVERFEDAGSGANFSPWSARVVSRWSWTTPGWTVAR